MNQKSAFSGVERVLGHKALERLKSSRVLVIGVGGVGSWVLESLARTGVGTLGLMDLDDVCVSNINRQLHALVETVGRPKVEVMSERLKGINPEVRLVAIHDFYTPEEASVIFEQDWDLIVDAVDSLQAKVSLAVECRKRAVPLLMIGGAAGKRDPSLLHVCDLADTIQDPLLFRVRKKLRLDHGFPAPQKKRKDGPARKKMKILCVSSKEAPLYPDGQGGICSTPPSGASVKLDCASGLGSLSYVTGAFGLLASSCAVNLLLKGNSDVG